MIVLRPDVVVFDGDSWGGVVRVSFDRVSSKTLEAYGELGPYPTLVDVVRQRVVIRVTQEIEGDDLASPVPGDAGELELVASAGSDVGRTRLRCPCVVESVVYRVSDYSATRSITLLAMAEDGDEDPVEIDAL
jgi:hypothetical protein